MHLVFSADVFDIFPHPSITLTSLTFLSGDQGGGLDLIDYITYIIMLENNLE